MPTDANKKTFSHFSEAFTIVELLVVVAVIAVLAAITIVSYTNVTNQAKKASLSSGLNSATKSLETYREGTSTTETYPASLSQMTGLKLDNSINWSYTTTSANNEYCLQGTVNGMTRSVSSTNSSAVDKPCGTLDGLVGWWKMDNNANDSSGNGNDYEVIGATLATGQDGIANHAYLFDGLDNYLKTKNVFTSTLNNGTVSFWCYTNGRGLYTTGNNQEGKINIGDFRPLIYGTGDVTVDWSGASSQYMGGFSLNDLVWTHVVATWNNSWSGTSNGSVSVYQNGILKNSYANVTLSANSTTDYVYIGRYSSGPSSPYNGLIDDVRIYNRALSNDEVSALYSAGAQ